MLLLVHLTGFVLLHPPFIFFSANFILLGQAQRALRQHFSSNHFPPSPSVEVMEGAMIGGVAFFIIGSSWVGVLGGRGFMRRSVVGVRVGMVGMVKEGEYGEPGGGVGAKV